MNWAQFKVPASHMCCAGAVLASWFVIQEVVGSNTAFLQKKNIFQNLQFL